MAAPYDAKGWVDLARQVEDLGYSTFTMPDHFNQQLAPVPALMAAAAATERLRIGALVFDNDYKHPVVLAKELATMDVLSDGRLEIGIGAGWMASDYEASGIAYDPPGVRIDRFEEALAVIKGALAEGPFSFAGQHYTITDYDGAAAARPAAAPAAAHRRRWPASAVDRRARSRHRRHQRDDDDRHDRTRGAGDDELRDRRRPDRRRPPRRQGRAHRRHRVEHPGLLRQRHRGRGHRHRQHGGVGQGRAGTDRRQPVRPRRHRQRDHRDLAAPPRGARLQLRDRRSRRGRVVRPGRRRARPGPESSATAHRSVSGRHAPPPTLG